MIDVAGTRAIGPTTPHPFTGLDVPWLVDLRARTRGTHPWLVWQPFDRGATSLTFAQVAERSARVASGLARRGVGPGDRVLVHLDNSPEFLLTWLACARLGAVAVTTNTRLAADELAWAADHAGVVGAVSQPGLADLVDRAVPTLGWLAVTTHDAGVEPPDSHRPDRASSFAALMGDPDAVPLRPPDPAAPVGIQYTSGTTARPKGVVWTHANALFGARTNAAHEDLRASDISLVQLPTYHANALCYSLLATLWVGATAVLLPRFSASRFWDLSLRHRCTWAIQTRFTWKALRDLETPGPGRHQYRLWGNAVSDTPDDTRHGVRTIGWWGMTETVSHGFVSDVHTPGAPLSIGRPAPEYGIHVEDEAGRAVGPDEPGLLLVDGLRGVSLFAEYLDDPDATRAAYDERGRFRTGDRVVQTAEGDWFFVDRDRDVLRVGGENVASSEIERVAATVDGVDEVAVVGRPHDLLEEEPVAFVILRRPDVDDPGVVARGVVAACQERLADFKVPRAVHVVDELPRATLGKVAKAQLRRRLVDDPTGLVDDARAVDPT